jgi:hypothetical protein
MKNPTTKILTLASALVLVSTPAFSQAEQADSPSRRFHVGSSLFMLANVVPMDDPPSFYQVNVGYELTDKDVVSLEAITWQYHAPVGVPWSSMGEDEENYPGSVREYGVGVAYQRFLWKDLYAGTHVLPLVKEYRDEDGEHIQNGFRLFLTQRVGYRVRLLQDRFFLEPSIAATYWPIDTNLPESFAAQENKWPNHFLFEPGLHFGVKF